MRIGIDARFITRKPRRGIGNYSLNLVNALVNLDSSIEFVLYIAEADNESLLPQLPNVRIRQLWPTSYPFWENIALPIAVKQDDLDILHCLGNTAPLFLPSSVQLVLSIMDVMFLQSGEFVPKPTTWYQSWGRLYRALSVHFVSKKTKKIITISDFSRKDIMQLISGITMDRVCVTHLSCDSIFLVTHDAPFYKIKAIGDVLSSPFILCLGAEDPRKNTLRFVKAYLNLLARGLITDSLIICGYSNWEKSASFVAVKAAGAEHKVKFLQFVSIDDLAVLYSNATVFAYPSLYEGFGIPMLEAFSSGCPVMASNVTSIPEVGGDAALYFDPLSISAMESALLQLVRNPGLRQDLVARGYERAKLFTWAETASKTMAVYRECMGESGL
jgi:glycosyltransferase involved in cell wall biosynthesis